MNAEIVKSELEKLDAFSGKLNETALSMANILDKEVPLSMRMNVANYALASFVTHFHVKLSLDDSFVPVNYIGFTLAQSGSAKTSSVNKLERALGYGYAKIDEYRKSKQEERAKAEADANDDENWLKYVRKLNPLFNSLSTEAGLIKRLNDFKNEGIGLPSLFVDELGTELQTNQDIVPNIKLVSELFDVGNKKSKAIKDEANQSDEVNGMGMCALFIGSEHNILLDEAILKKFNTEFITKLARRSFFNFPEFVSKEPEYKTIDEILQAEEEDRELQTAHSVEIKELSGEIADTLIGNDNNIIFISPEAERLYRIYKFHCKYESAHCQDEAVLLEQLHRHWKVLKLAGAYCVMKGNSNISKEDIIEAISFAEMVGNDLHKFIELSKRDLYEVLIDLLKTQGSATVHELKKRELINGTGKAETKVQALIELGNSKLGNEGMLKFDEGIVSLELFKPAEHGASYISVSGTKEERAFKTREGYTYKKTSFDKLSNLLCNDTAYCPFEFRDGIRSNDNILGGATFVVLDIDDSDITWEEAHDMLQDYNHHIAKTSDEQNPYKFRCIIELDIEVKIESRLWKQFMSKVGEHLGLKLDLLAQSQIYYGFSGREVKSVLDMDSLPASEFIKNLSDVQPPVKKLPSSKRKEAFENKFEVFQYAYEADGETKASYLYRAFKHAADLGFSKEEVYALIEDITDYHGTDINYIFKRTGLNNQIERYFQNAQWN